MPATHDASLALRADGALAAFHRAGILSAADVHVARRLGVIGGETDDAVLLAAALVVRSTRHGSVVLDLATAAETTSPDVDEEADGPVVEVALEWPVDWAARCANSPLVGGPLRMAGTRLWLARYWDQEEQVARELLERCAARPSDLDLPVLAAGLDRLFVAGDDDQRLAAASCALSRVSVLAGGPGTGKTTTVSRLLALLLDQHPDWRIALAAPTGKAAARLEEAVRSSTVLLPAQDRARLGDLSATTLHRLLGWRPEARSRFRHDRTNRLPVEVVVIDEASMVSLTMMARLLEALRPSTRLVLVGDPDQLASVEAGAVLGDLVDRATLGRRTAGFAAELRAVVPTAVVDEQPASPAASVRDGVAALLTNRRFPATSGIALLAGAVQDGRGEDALAVLRSHDTAEVELVDVADDAQLSPAQLDGVRADVVIGGAALLAAAERGDGAAALEALDRHRLLCAHRRGPRGVQHWSALAARWIADDHPVTPRADGRYAGEPLLVTANDYDIGLYNGDTGVVIDDGHGGLVAAFGRGGAPIRVPLVRLGAVRSLHAMTVHRSQGSQFARITVLLPAAGSPLGTRETLYTAVTRATTHVRVIGSAEALVDAVGRPAARATGLRERLRGEIG
ncbi:MAG: exodeoxyribonuclease V subunit alpha [Actinomycetes bacterium]